MEFKSKITQRKGFLTRDIVISGLLFTGIIAIFVLMIAGVADNYNNTEIINEDISNNYDKLSTLTGNLSQSLDEVQSGDGLKFTGTFEIVFSATFTVIKMIFGTISLYGTIVANFVSDFTFLDSSVIKVLLTLGMAILTTIVMFIWISSITRGKL